MTRCGRSRSGAIRWLRCRSFSQHSLYEWKKKFAGSDSKGNDEAEEIRRLKKELARVTEERDILKKAAAYFARDAK
ncbi:protein of unknown function (plasmid) [Agrobacterium pusense]|uniref:Transposase n=1 Tax=Agrobacterium pusense TaxID=648995 RepID=U4Q410_9HYPH|nr:protein of unknown function [Agrobacterium pusense]